MKLQAGIPVTGSKFIGRKDEINQIVSFLEMGQSVVILAPRRFGKTSLVMEVLRRMGSSQNYTAFVDVFSTPTIPLLSQHIVEAVLKNHRMDRIFTKTRNSAMQMIRNAKLKAVLEDFEFILGFSEREPDQWQLLGDSIDFIDQFASRHYKSIYCAFDEFGDIRKLDGDKIIKLFRSKIQQHKASAYLFSGSYESVMNSIFVTKSSPFYRFARIIKLGYIDKQAFVKQYEHYFSYFGIVPDFKLINQVLDFTKGHPYYSQLALQEMLIFHSQNKKFPSFREFKIILENSEKSYLEKSWEELSAKKGSIAAILALVRSEGKLYASLQKQGLNPYRAIQTLINQGVISKSEESGYLFNDPLLEYWIRKNILRV